MKIILTLLDMDIRVEEDLIERFQEKVDDKSPNNSSPLRYVDKLEVER